MTYPFVPSFTDLGPRKGPVLGFLIHMAEGGGTVGYLSRKNPNGVSVHYVIEGSGRIVQMLSESHMHSSIRIGDGGSALRRTTDADGFYGATAAVAVLGEWAYVTSTLGPNHATIAVEIEGFAAKGPNARQSDALVQLVADVRSRHPGIGLTGHRDHNVKACPGHLIPWDRVGGHGPEGEAPMSIYQLTPTSGTLVIPAGRAVPAYRPSESGWAVVKTRPAAKAASAPIPFTARVGRISGSTVPSSLVLIDKAHPYFGGLYVDTATVAEHEAPADGDPTPYSTEDLAAAIAADRLTAHIEWSA